MIKATFAALDKVASPRSVALRRGKKISEVLGRKATEASGTETHGEEKVV
jgi:small subunit ribosomal protein S5